MFANDGSRAAGSSSDAPQLYFDFDLGVPAGANILGISVKIEARDVFLLLTSTNLRLSWDGGSSWSSSESYLWPLCVTLVFCLDIEKAGGGTTDLWDRTWSASEFSNANFAIQLDATSPTNVNVDFIQIRVDYEPFSPANSTVNVSDVVVDADGSSTSTITVTVRDDSNAVFSSGGNTVVLAGNGSQTFSAITDNNNGTYTATISNTVTESVTISATVDGESLTNTVDVAFGTYYPGGLSGNLQAWYNADVGISGTTSITQWTDQSRNNKHVTQTANTFQPSLNTASSALNFHRSIELDGDRDHLDTTGLLSSNTADMTVFVVLSMDTSAGTYNKPWGFDTESTNPGLAFLSTGQALIYDSSFRFFNVGQSVPFSELFIHTSALDYPGTDGSSFSYLNGEENSTSIVVENSHLGTGNFDLGGSHIADEDIDGRLAEFILYDTLLTSTQRQQVESYLAIKYGVTLTNDYLDSNSTPTTVFTVDVTYNNDIAGLAKDADTNLDQRISKSINSSAVLTLSTDSDFSAENRSHANTLSDGAYLVVGHDGGSAASTTTSDIANNFEYRLIREWKVQSTGTVGTVQLNLSSLPALASDELYVLLEDSDGNFNAGFSVLDTSFTTTFDNVTFSTGTNYFTVAVLKASTADSLISISSGVETADGISSATITVQVKDGLGIDFTFGGHNISLVQSGSASISAVTDNNDGSYTATITSPIAEAITITGSIGGSSITDTAAITFVPGPITTSNTTISVSTSALTADGVSSSTITVQAIDALGNLLTTGGSAISLAQNGGATISGFNDNSDGTYTAIIQSTLAGAVTITGQIGASDISDNALVTFNPGPATTTNTIITVSTGSLTADGSSISIITVQTIDALGNNLDAGGDTIVLFQNGSALLSGLTDNSNGTYTANLSSAVAESILITGTLNSSGITSNVVVIFVPGPASTTTTTISTTASSLTANGAAVATITVQAIDALGNNLTSGGLALSLTENGSANLTAYSDNSNGTYTATITSTVAEPITISGSIGGSPIADTAAITFNPGPITVSQTSLSTSAAFVTANGVSSATLTVQAQDAFGNNITSGGATITLTQDGSANLSSVTDNSNGSYTATITSTVAEAITIRGSIGASAITDTTSIIFNPGPADTTNTTLSVTSTNLVADGVSTSVIIVIAIDAQGNNLTAGGSNIGLSENGSASISAVSDNGNGSYSATISSTVAETITLTADIAGSTIVDNETITFTPGAPTALRTTISVDATSVTADGFSRSNITVQIKDNQGNNVTTGGLAITLSDNGSAIISTVTDNGNGTYSASITSTVAEVITISGMISTSTIGDTATVSFVPGVFSIVQSTISVSSAVVTANGTSTSTITVQATDAFGNDLTSGGLTIALMENGNAVISGITDNFNGSYTATISNTLAEPILITGTMNSLNIADNAALTFVPGPANSATTTISVSSATSVADGTAFSSITVQTTDAQGNNLTTGGIALTLAENGSATISAITDNNNGTYSAIITNVVAETITITGRISGSSITDTAVVTFDPGPAVPAQTTISVSSATVTANGVTTSIITVQAKDALGNNITSGGLSINLTEDGSANLSSVTDNGNGTYTATISSTLAENITIRGTLAAVSIFDTAAVNFIPGAANISQTAISVSSAIVVANGSTISTITIQTTDAQGNNLTIGGTAIALSENGSAILSSVIDNANGTYTATIRSTLAEVITISGTISGSTITDTASVSFIPGPPTTGTTTVSVSSSTVTADGSSNSTITIQIKDAQGNNATAGGLTISITEDGSANITPVIDNNNGTYAATITDTVAEVITINATISGSLIADTATVNFIPGAANTSQSAITVSSASIVADGTTTSTITLRTTDAQGNNLTTGGLSIALFENGSANIGTVTDNNNGTYSATITSTVAESITITGTINGSLNTDTATIEFIPGAATTTQTTISVSTASLTADGSSLSTITVQAKDAQNNNLVDGGLLIALTEDGSATISAITDNADGTYTATISSIVAEIITIRGTLSGSPLSSITTVTFNPGVPTTAQTTVSVSSNTVTADGISTTIVSVQTVDTFGNLLTIGGSAITLSQNGGATISPVSDNGNGTYTATIISTLAESIVVRSTLNTATISDIANVTFIPGAANAAKSTISISTATVIADGTSLSTITVQTKDVFNNNQPSGGLAIALTETSGAVISTILDNGNGTYTATITSLTVEQVIVRGTLGGSAIGNTVSIEFIPGAASELTTSLDVTANIITANGLHTATFTIRAMDAFDHPLVEGGDVVTVVENGSAVLTQVIDQLNGSYTATATNDTIEDVTFTFTINGATLPQTIKIDFVEGGVAELNATDGRFIYGTGPSGIVITVTDSSGNVICSTSVSESTDVYACPLSYDLAEGEVITITTTDLAGTEESVTTTITAVDSDNNGISDVIEDYLAANGGAWNTEKHTDTDGDSIPDFAEVLLGSNFLDANSPITNSAKDSDNDGVPNGVEYYFAQSGGSANTALSTDTDSDGIPDYTELLTESAKFDSPDMPIKNGNQDTDGDGIPDGTEYFLSLMSIYNVTATSDYDRDGFGDALEVRVAGNPLRGQEPDDDNDGITNAIEAFLIGTVSDNVNTLVRDRDGDQLPDLFEITFDTNFMDANDPINFSDSGDADNDGITDAVERYLVGNTSGLSGLSDTDRDGATDINEIRWGSNPYRNSEPVTWLDVDHVNQGSVVITANTGGHQAPPPTYIWDLTSLYGNEPNAGVFYPNNRSINISGLAVGHYEITIQTTRTIGSKEFGSKVTHKFSVFESAVDDADHDGVTNNYDVFDGMNGEEELLNSAIGYYPFYALESQEGTQIRLGHVARMGGNAIANLTPLQLADYFNQRDEISSGDMGAITDLSLSANLYDIEIVNLPETGASVTLVLPLHQPLTDESTALVLNPETLQWEAFSTLIDRVMSYTGNPGECQSADFIQYNTVLTEGNFCVLLHVTDGGDNDADGRANGVIQMLVAVGSIADLPIAPDIPPTIDGGPNPIIDGGGDQGGNAGKDSGGGSFGFFILVLLGFYFGVRRESSIANTINNNKLSQP